MAIRPLALILALTAGIVAASAGAANPTFVTSTIDDTQFFAFTSSACGFPMYEHDTGTVTTMFRSMHPVAVRGADRLQRRAVRKDPHLDAMLV
jgi:hypothetical protein